MTRSEILDTAKHAVCGERDKQYGKPEDNFAQIAAHWSQHIKGRYGVRIPFDGVDVAAMMIAVKLARISTGAGKNDNWIDIAGYAACGGEME